MDQKELQTQVLDFERKRAQLMNVSGQKQQFQFQDKTLEKAIEELSKTKEEKVYKAVGNILILSPVKEVQKELKDQKETIEVIVKTLEKQEEQLMDSLNKLKSGIEKATGQKVEEADEE